MAKKNTTKYNSNKQEKRVAKELNAKLTIASGSLAFQKADVRNDIFLIECKTTSKDFYNLKEDVWLRIEKQAIKDGIRTPLMCIDLNEGKDSYAVIKYLDFIGYDLDMKAQYLGNTEPTLIDTKSFKLTGDFKREPFSIELVKGQYPCYRQDIKFINSNTHLVILPWEDFINIAKDI